MASMRNRRRSSTISLLLAALLAVTVLVIVSPQPADAAEIVFEDGFETGNLDLWDNVHTSRFAITSNPARVHSGSYALEGTIPEGPGWGEINKWFMPGYDEIYVRFNVMFEEGFQNLRGDNNGMHFVSVSGNRIDNKWSAHGKAGIVPNGYDFFTTTVDPEHPWGDPTLRPLMFYSYFPDMQCCYGNLFKQEEPKTPLLAGEWHEIIIHVDAGTPGQHDGAQRLWVDGDLKIDVQGMRWRNTTDLRLNEFHIVDYMPGSPQTQHIWFDNILITTDFPGSEVAGSRFVDVPDSHLFHDDIEWLAAEGITLGCNPPLNTRFCPDGRVTRGQFAAFLTRALSLPPSPDDRFTDDDDSVFENDIQALAAADITRGCNPPTNDRFCPDRSITRGEIAALLARALNLPPSSTDVFTDDDSSIFEADIQALAAAGITAGCNPPSNDRFCPDRDLTRAQLAAFLERAIGS